MENYIKNYFEVLLKEYPDVDFYACDVVNEAWTDQGAPRDAGSNNVKNGQSAWVQIFGDNSFVEPAFTYARKYAPKIPNCAAAPNKNSTGCARRVPKSIMAPIPINRIIGSASDASIPI